MANAPTTEDRIQQQLDRLDDPNLTEKEIEKIEKKIAVLRGSTD